MKNNGKLVSYFWHDNAPEDKALIKITNDSQWRLGIIAECTGKGKSHRNHLAELGFADIIGKARAMMVQANLPEEIKYKLCKECFNCSMYLSNLAVVTLNGKAADRYEHFHETKPIYAKHLRIWEKLVQYQWENWKVGNTGTPMIFVS